MLCTLVKENKVQFVEDYNLSNFCLQKDMKEMFTKAVLHFLKKT